MAGHPWVEKHRPRTLREVVAHDEVVTTIRKMAEKGELPHLLLYGPPGTGKTSTILALARDMPNWEVLELNASDERGIDVVRAQIKEFVSSRRLRPATAHPARSPAPSVAQPPSAPIGTSFATAPLATSPTVAPNEVKQNAANKTGVLGGFAGGVGGFAGGVKLVVLDEADALTFAAQMALRRIVEQFSASARFCLIANYANKLIPAILSRCVRFRFAPLPDRDIAERVRHVAALEGVTVDIHAVAALLRVAAGDLRKAINTLQAAALAAPPPPPQPTPLTSTGGSRNVPSDEKKGGAGAGCVVTEGGVYASAGMGHPSELATLYKTLKAGEYKVGYAATKKLVFGEGRALGDLARGLHDLVLNDAVRGNWPQKSFQTIIHELAEIERRLAAGASERLQLAALPAIFTLAK